MTKNKLGAPEMRVAERLPDTTWEQVMVQPAPCSGLRTSEVDVLCGYSRDRAHERATDRQTHNRHRSLHPEREYRHPNTPHTGVLRGPRHMDLDENATSAPTPH
jgi:hypothetical protein